MTKLSAVEIERNFPSRLRRARKNRGLSQKDISLHSSGLISGAYVSKLESGDRRPSLETLEVLGDVLEVDPFWLRTGKREQYLVVLKGSSYGVGPFTDRRKANRYLQEQRKANPKGFFTVIPVRRP